MSKLAIIELYRGNSKYIDITPLSGETGEPLIMGDKDKVIFAVKGLLKTYIHKEFTKVDQDEETGNISFRISPEETLSFPPGTYECDCLYIFSDPVIDPFTFITAQVVVYDVAAKIGGEYNGD